MRSLRFKILTVAAASILVSQIGTVTTVLVTANRDVSARALRTLEAGSSVLKAANESRANEIANTVTALAADYGLKQAIGTADAPTMQSALSNHARRAGADVALIVDADGNSLASLGARLTDLPRDQLLDDEASAYPGRLGWVSEGVAYELIGVPVRAPLPIAWLVMGFAVTDAYADRLNELTGLGISVLAGDDGAREIVASSLPANARAALAASDSVVAAEPTTVDVDGADYLLISRPFIDGERSLRVLLTQSLAEAMAPYRLLQKAAIALGALPLLLGLCGALFLSRTLTRPVKQLVDAAGRVQAGDYSEAVALNTGNELDQLADAINAMQDGIAEREKRITYQSEHDQLTGLANRRFALERLASEIDAARRCGARLSVMVIDLNALSEIAETLGHDVADGYLQQAANQLRSFVRSPHILARLDTDSFLLVLPGLAEGDASDVAERLIARLESGVGLPDINVSVQPTIGIATFPEHGRTHDQLLQRATIARARDDERGIAIYEDGDEEQRQRRMALIHDLRRATREQELKMYYQPKVNVDDGTVCGAEALVRWDHPRFGWLSPSEFIPALEQSGNITVLTRWALTKAAEDLRRWRAAGLDVSLSVNFSAQDLRDPDLPWFVKEVLDEHQLPPPSLIVEITEEAMVRDFEQAKTVLGRLREFGVWISIDDFGTGYSSLAQLKNLPVDEIKIDRSFVARLPENEADAAIVRAAVELSHQLGLECVAEGIETGAAFRWMQANNVERAQGFYFSEPLAADNFDQWLRNFTGGATVQTRALQLT